MSSEPEVPLGNVILACVVCIAVSFLVGIGCGEHIGQDRMHDAVCSERKVYCPVEFKIP